MSDHAVRSVLHVLRLRGTTADADVAERAGLDADTAADVLATCRASGWVRHHTGALVGWTLTAEGRREGERRLAAELDGRGARPLVEAAYERFLELNGELLAVCTDWQVVRRGGREVVNDHADARHDGAVLARLGRLHEAARPLTGELADALGRFAGYGPRLDGAAARVLAGEHEWLTRPLIDSYHTVWFELHEDLLATLGRERTQERDMNARAGAHR
jgi:hypothetical protein